MKRFLILLSLLALLLTGCTAPTTDTELPASEPPLPQDVSIVLTGADLSADPPTLTITWYNPLEQTVYTTSEFDILHIGDNGLETCFDDTHYYADAEFTLKCYEVAPRSTLAVTYDIAPYILPRGEELWFTCRYSVEDRRTAGISELCFEITEGGNVVPIFTDGDNAIPPFSGFYPYSDDEIPLSLFDADTAPTDSLFYLSLDRQATEDGYTVLDITWHNDSGVDAWYGEPYDIEYYDGKHWVSVITDENAVWIMPAYSLPAGGTSQKTYTPDRYGLFDLSKAGRYRFSSDCSYTDGNGETVRKMLTLEFTVD